MKKKSLLLSLLCLPFLFSCSKGSWYGYNCNNFIQTIGNEFVRPFNTEMILCYYKKSNKKYPSNYNENITKLYNTNVNRLHKILDRHNYYFDENGIDIVTNVKSINDSYATGDEIVCSDELYSLLKLGYQLTLDSHGYFNFFMGQLTSFWDNILDSGEFDETLDPLYNPTQKDKLNKITESTPSLEEIMTIFTFNDEKKSVIFNSIEDIYEDEEKTIIKYDRKSNLSKYRPYITSGGIAKGHATDILKDILNDNGYFEGYLNSGRSSITSLSDFSFTGKDYHKISITDPRPYNFNSDTCLTLNLYGNYSLSTSGNYTNGKSYSFIDQSSNKRIYRHHIINPYTGECSQEHSSVTLISTTLSNGQLDALSTAFENMPTEEGFKFRNEIIEKYSTILNKECDLNVVYIDINDETNKLEVTVNESFKKFVSKDIKDVVITYA